MAPTVNVTRFGEISPFWPKVNNLRQTFDRFSFEPTLAQIND